MERVDTDSPMASEEFEPPAKPWRLYLLIGLFAMGTALAIWQPVSVDDLLALGQRFGGSPLFIAAIMALMILLYTFGLTGSIGLFLIAPFNPPWLATALLVLASVTGGLCAYGFAAFLGRNWKPSGASDKIFNLLKRRGDLVTQIALRMLPGFPHSIVNYACGALRLPLSTFITAAAIGLTIKWAVFANAVHGLYDAVAEDAAIDFTILWPLFALPLLFLAGAWIKRRLG